MYKLLSALALPGSSCLLHSLNGYVNTQVGIASIHLLWKYGGIQVGPVHSFQFRAFACVAVMNCDLGLIIPLQI